MRLHLILLLGCVVTTWAQTVPAPTLTIYNQDFAVVRQRLRLNLQSGVTKVRYEEITAQVEPDSVVLRDANGRRSLEILEQRIKLGGAL